MKKGRKHILKKILKVIAWITIAIVLLLVAFIFSLRLPSVQHYITKKAIGFYQKKVDAKAAVDRIYVDFPTNIAIEGLYLEDMQGDTLLFVEYLSVNTDLWALTGSELNLDEIEVDGLRAFVHRSAGDSTFNYNFIVEAFSSPSAAPADTTSAGFDFSIDDVDIANTHVSYIDKPGGIDFTGDLGKLLVEFEIFDLNTSHLSIDNITLRQSKATLTLSESTLAPDTTTADNAFTLGGREILIDEVNFLFEDKASNIRLRNNIGLLNVIVDSLDINKNVYKAREIKLENSFIAFDQFTTQDTIASADTLQTEPIALRAGSQGTQIVNSAFRYYDHNEPVAQGFDPAHLWLQKLNVNLGPVAFENGNVAAEIKSLAVKEKNGMVISQFQTSALYTDQQATLDNLELRLGNTNISGELLLEYPSVAALTDQPEKIKLDIDLNNSTVDLNDMLYFAPDLEQSLTALQGNYRYRIDTRLTGTLGDLKIGRLNVAGLSNTVLKANGEIKGLPDAQTARYNLQVADFQTSSKDIKSLVADSLLPPTLKLPKEVSVKLDFLGYLNDFETSLNLRTSLGNVDYRGTFKIPEDSIYQYKGKLSVDQLQLDTLIQNTDLGLVSLNAEIDGEGFSLEEVNTIIKGEVSQFSYRDYDYKGFQINGQIKRQRFIGDLNYNDENLQFDFNGLVNLSDSTTVYTFTLDLQQADLYALNLTSRELKVRTNINSNLNAKSIETINGTLNIENFTVVSQDTYYEIDSISLIATTTEELTDIRLKSSIVDADFKGDFELNTLPKVIQNHISHYLNKSDTLGNLKPQSFTFNIDFKNPRFFTEVLLPDLKRFEPGVIKGVYNSADWQIDVEIGMKRIVYKNIDIDSLGMELTSDKATLNFVGKVAQIKAQGFVVDNIVLEGLAQDDFIKTDLKILDDEREERYHLGGKIGQNEESNYAFMFEQGEFVLNYDPWKVQPSNSIEFLPNGVWINDLKFNKDQQEILFQSQVEDSGDSLITAAFKSFDLGFTGKLDTTEAYALAGSMDGKVDLNTTQKSMSADIKVEEFAYKGDTLGNINLVARNVDNKTNLKLDITGSQNEIAVEGYVLQEAETNLNLDIDLNRLDIATIEAFTQGQATDMEGDLTGNFKVRGTTADPDITGSLKFNGIAFNVTYLGTGFSIDDQSIAVNNTGISFSNFVVNDADKNKLTLDGTIKSADYKKFDFGLKLNTNNFLVLNTDEKQNDLFYGRLRLNSQTDITGNQTQPKVRLNLSLSDDSHFTYVIPESEIAIAEQEGVVEFYDKDHEDDPFYQDLQKKETDTTEYWISGIDLKANIEVSDANTLGIVIDPITQDKLTISGSADLALSIRPSGDMTLTGRYEVNDGAYNLNFYGLAKRQFDIQKGSYILWTGDPLNARMDVTAAYEVRAAPLDVEGFNSKIPFTVYLNIREQLLSPDISFRLAVEESAAPSAVQSYVSRVNQQQSDLNQQVFSLLLFKSFMSSGSIGSGNGNIAQSTARNSVSRILTNQLNRLSGKIKGVELSFDLQSYEEAGESGTTGRTELELGLSKQFFDNRVVVKVAGNFDIEGGSQQQQSASDFAGDIRVEYKLTEDGRFRLVGFRQNEYDNLLQGEITKTGAGIIFVRDYNTLKELFKPKEKAKETEEDKDE